MGHKEGELSILVTVNGPMRELNKRWRQVDSPTDVLAFPMEEESPVEGMPLLLGDVVLSVERAREQAEERGWTLLEELTFLLIHGILHLLGWDHGTSEEEEAMTRETERLMRLFPSSRRVKATRR